MSKKRIYLDYAAATPVRKEAEKAMRPYLSAHFENPSALYKEADATKEALETARKDIAKVLHVRPFEVIFTSGSTEANNLAILGYEKAQKKAGTILSTPIEHSSIQGPLADLEKRGWNVVYVPVDNEGLVIIEDFEKLLTNSPKLLTLAWANPDIGTVQGVNTIGRLCKKHGVTLHVDASQAGGLLPLVTAGEAADMVTLSSAKAYGPRGIGALAVRSSTVLAPLLYGGGHERGLRSGTENVAGAVGFATALRLAEKEQKNEAARLQLLRDLCIEKVVEIGDIITTGAGENRLANHASFAIKNIDGEELVVRLDARGVAVGTGSACATGEDHVSEAVRQIGVPKEYQSGTLRVTLGKETTKDDILTFVLALDDAVREIRQFNE